MTDKENAPPASDRPPVPPFNSADAPYVLPLELAQLHQSIKDTLQKSFTDHPPYTLQRLSELILQPKKHYRFLGPYLRALDRVVNVSSNVNHYPLTTGPHSNLVNGGGPTPPNSGTCAFNKIHFLSRSDIIRTSHFPESLINKDISRPHGRRPRQRRVPRRRAPHAHPLAQQIDQRHAVAHHGPQPRQHRRLPRRSPKLPSAE